MLRFTFFQVGKRPFKINSVDNMSKALAMLTRNSATTTEPTKFEIEKEVDVDDGTTTNENGINEYWEHLFFHIHDDRTTYFPYLVGIS